MTDRRRKVPESEYPTIRAHYAQGKSLREIANLYNVSHGLIDYILNPEHLAKAKALRAQRGKEGRYKTKK